METPSSEAAFRHLVDSIDFHRPSRAEWRATYAGRQRTHAQSLLLWLAEGARSAGTEADRRALYQAAYAVLPLHGAELRELAGLLVALPTPPLEWCDALVEALAREPRSGTELAARVLDGLGRTLRAADASEPACRRLQWIRAQVTSLGYRPSWLDQDV